MVKKLILFIVALLPSVIYAALPVGEWQIPTTTGTPGDVVEADRQIYYLSQNNLYAYYKGTDEIAAYHKTNFLSDSDIQNLYYNRTKKYLLIVYSNSNIDLLFDDGRVINIPDLKNTTMSVSKVINDVVFGENRIYLATDFGLVVLNDVKYEVAESFNYARQLKYMALIGEDLYAVSDNLFYKIALKDPKYIFGQWSRVDMQIDETVNDILAVKDTYLVYIDGEKIRAKRIADDVYMDCSGIWPAAYLKEAAGGFVAYLFKTVMATVYSDTFENDKLTIIKKYQYPESKSYLNGSVIGTYQVNNEYVWAANETGLYKVRPVADWDVDIELGPLSYNTLNVFDPFYIQKKNGKMYISNSGPRRGIEEQYIDKRVSTIDENGNWEVVNFLVPNGGGGKKKLNAGYNLAFDPDDAEIVYIGTWFDGIYKFVDGECVGQIDEKNSPIVRNYTCCANEIYFDDDKNMWVFTMDNTAIMILPRAKQSLSLSDLKPSDWYTISHSELNSNKYLAFLDPKRSDYKWILKGLLNGHVAVLDDKGTLNTSRDDKVKQFISFVDQDGKTFTSTRYACLLEDRNGSIWVGCLGGAFIISNPDNAFSDNFRITRIKVPRNDGTDYADYLLEDELVVCMAVDGANRKWLGSENSGAYLVSADGTEIIAQYNTDNSPIPSNYVTAITVDSETGEVYMGTKGGLAIFRSDAIEAADNFDNVYAYPNPVRPDYSGWISVVGLKENSLVKITDVAGNLFFQGYSNGGQIVWDGCDRSGNRVKTGVYLVLASTSDGKSGVVTKILVVK